MGFGCRLADSIGRCGRMAPRSTEHPAARAKVAELVDALDLGSSAARRGGSSPFLRTRLSSTNVESTECRRNLETLGQLERRLTMAVPVADIDKQVDERLKQARAHGAHGRLPPGQGAAQARRAAVRPAGALRGDRRCGAEIVLRRGARAEPARRGLSAHRAQGGGRRGAASSSARPSRSTPKCSSATSRARASSARR